MNFYLNLKSKNNNQLYCNNKKTFINNFKDFGVHLNYEAYSQNNINKNFIKFPILDTKRQVKFIWDTWSNFNGNNFKIYTNAQNIIIFKITPKMLISFLYFCRDNYQYRFKNLTDIYCFEIFKAISQQKSSQILKEMQLYYYLLSPSQGLRCRVDYLLTDFHKNSIHSITKIFPGANWVEREIFDLQGIFFKGHPDLRRILTDYGFSSFPLKKQYNLNQFLNKI
jgi:NADH:ubiquinone oxidoreductase subunit C